MPNCTKVVWTTSFHSSLSKDEFYFTIFNVHICWWCLIIQSERRKKKKQQKKSSSGKSCQELICCNCLFFPPWQHWPVLLLLLKGEGWGGGCEVATERFDSLFFFFFWRNRLVSPGVYYSLSDSIIPLLLWRSGWELMAVWVTAEQEEKGTSLLACRLLVATRQTSLAGVSAGKAFKLVLWTSGQLLYTNLNYFDGVY